MEPTATIVSPVSPVAPDPYPLPSLPAAPGRLSGTVLVAMLNDAATLDALGPAAHAAPYLHPPRAPVLAVKPRHTWAHADSTFVLPPGCEQVSIGASVACVLGRTLARGAGRAAAQESIVAWTLAVDLTLPTSGWYRPAVRARAAVGSLRLAAPVVVAPPTPVTFEVRLDDAPPWRADTARFVRDAATLLADIAEFMTLHPGDAVLLGVPEGSPQARAGQRVRVSSPGLGSLEFRVEAEA